MASDAVSSILSKMGEGSAPAEQSGAEEYDAGLETAAGEVIAAVEAKDAGALVTALKSFVEMCK